MSGSRRGGRALLSAGTVVVLAGGLLAAGTAFGGGSPPEPAAPSVAAPATAGDGVAALQEQLRRVPANDRAWAQLGAAYVQQARTTADPGLYAKAEGAFAESLRLRPDGNDLALTGQASLAAAQHEFARAVELSDAALEINPYSSGALATKVDGLVELGRYDASRDALEQLLGLRPGLDAFTRASYAQELRGDVDGARAALERAAQVASVPADRAFAQHYLGELAWHSGELDRAASAYDAALAADPTHVPALAGRAKVKAARGDVDGAVADYRAAVGLQPQPGTLVELGELLESLGRTDEAQQQYAVVRATQQLFQAGGQVVDAELALFEADHGDPAVAVELARQAHEARPDSIHVQDAYAWALHAAGRDDEALPLARAAARTGLRSPSFAYHLGVVEAAAGDRDDGPRGARAGPAAQPGLQPAARAARPGAARRAVVRRVALRALVVAGLAGGTLVGAAPAASAHPLGNFTVNTADRVVVGRSDVTVLHAVDLAEIPTLQLTQGPDSPDADRDGALADGELASWAAAECARAVPQLSLVLDGQPAGLEVVSSGARRTEGAAGLPTLRLDCGLRTSTVPASTVAFEDRSAVGRTGWKEVSATALCGSVGGDVAPESASGLLEAYPEDLLSSPLDVTSASFTVETGGSCRADSTVPGSRVLPAEVDRLTAAYSSFVSAPGADRPGRPARRAAVHRARRRARGGAGARQDGHRGVPRRSARHPPAGGLARCHRDAHAHRGGAAARRAAVADQRRVAGAVRARDGGRVGAAAGGRGGVPAAARAAGEGARGELPGDRARPQPRAGRAQPRAGWARRTRRPRRHGDWPRRPRARRPRPRRSRPPARRSRARPRTVTTTRTATTTTTTAATPTPTGTTTPTTSTAWATAGGTATTITPTTAAATTTTAPATTTTTTATRPAQLVTVGAPAAAATATLAATAPAPGEHTHAGSTHRHVPEADQPLGWRTLATMGIAGGLVPSPSALVVLLGAAALGRPVFGALLVVGYGVGMALTLTLAGLLLLRAQARLERRGWTSGRAARLVRVLPMVTAGVVLLVGGVIVLRGLVTFQGLG